MLLPADIKDFKLYPKSAEPAYLTAADFEGSKFKDNKYSQPSEWQDPVIESSEWSGLKLAFIVS